MAKTKEPTHHLGVKIPKSLHRRLTAWRNSRSYETNESSAVRYLLDRALADVPDPKPDADAEEEVDYQAEKRAHVFAPDAD